MLGTRGYRCRARSTQHAATTLPCPRCDAPPATAVAGRVDRLPVLRARRGRARSFWLREPP
ncbi:MAG: hypothetical protein ACRDLN_13840, partial [Solirubrobacteraceae bacterium]